MKAKSILVKYFQTPEELFSYANNSPSRFSVGIDPGEVDGFAITVVELHSSGIAICRLSKKFGRAEVGDQAFKIGSDYALKLLAHLRLHGAVVDVKDGSGKAVVKDIQALPKTVRVVELKPSEASNLEMAAEVSARIDNATIAIPNDSGGAPGHSFVQDFRKITRIRKPNGLTALVIPRDTSGHCDMFVSLAYAVSILPHAKKKAAICSDATKGQRLYPGASLADIGKGLRAPSMISSMFGTGKRTLPRGLPVPRRPF